MDTFDWPASFKPQSVEATLVPNTRRFDSPYGGGSQVLDLLGERWRQVLTLPPSLPGQAGAVDATMNRLFGGANRIRLPYFPRPYPMGTLRGSPTLSATALQGANSLSLSGCIGTNLHNFGEFETDDDADGIANGWTPFTEGSGGTIDGSLVTPDVPLSGLAQRVNTDSLGTTASDRAGITRTVTTDYRPGQPYTLSAWVRRTSSVQYEARIFLRFRNAGLTVLDDLATVVPLTVQNEWQRISVTLTAPATTTNALIRVNMQRRTGAAGGATIQVDQMQLEIGDVPSAYARTSLRAGDVIGLNGQHLQVAEDCFAAANGTMTVPLVNRVRAQVTSGTALVLAAPTATYTLADSSGVASSYGPGGLRSSVVAEFVEVW